MTEKPSIEQDVADFLLGVLINHQFGEAGAKLAILADLHARAVEQVQAFRVPAQ